MELFYIPGGQKAGRQVVIYGSEAKHIARVLRHKPGDEIYGTDGMGNEFRLKLGKVETDRVIASVVEKKSGVREPGHRIVLAQAVLKGDKLAQVVEGVTELGVNEILPFICRRVVGRMTEAKRHRLENVAISGMKSCTRTVLPRIGRVVDLAGLIERFAEFDQTIVAYEEERGAGLSSLLDRAAETVMVVIGPEGGFTPEEIDKMKNAGAVCCSLGPRRLRAEIAALAAVSVVLGLLGDLG